MAENRQLTGGGATYIYDGDGRRVKKTSGANGTSTYVYDAFGNLVLEYDTQTPALTGTIYITVDPLGSTRLVTSGS
jgi:YD repeat-containing protein